MIEAEGWQWSATAGPAWAVLALLVAVVLAAYVTERRAARRPTAQLLLRLVVVAWLAPALLGLEAWHEIREPRPARYLILADGSGSVAGRPELAADMTRAVTDLRNALAGFGDVQVRTYVGRGLPTLWASGWATDHVPGGPTRMIEDLAALPAADVADDIITILAVDGADPSLAAGGAVTVPVAAVLLPGDDPRPSPIWLLGVRSDAYALVRSPLRVEVAVGRQRGGPERGIVRVRDGDRILGEAPLAFARGAAVTDVTIDVLPVREGDQVLLVELVQHGEPIVEAAHATRLPVRVLRDRLRLLHVVGRPDWESRLVRELLRADPVVDLVSFQILRTIDDRPGAPDLELSLIPFPTEKLFTEELPKFDVVVFQNFDYAPYFPPAIARSLLENLARFVNRDGGGFVMTAGEQSFGFGRYERTPLAGILPVSWMSPAVWQPVQAPIMRDGRWGSWFGAQPPGGTGLVDRVTVAAPGPDDRVVWWAGEQPAVVVGRRGEGRTAAILTDRLWRAAIFGGATDRAAVADLWTRLLRWLAGDPQFEDLHVRWSQTRALPGATVEGLIEPADAGMAELIGEDGRVAGRVQARDGRFSLKLPAQAATWRLRVDGREAPEPLIAELPLEERTGPALPRESWQRWAAERGAVVADLRDARDPGLLNALQSRASSVTARRIEPIHAMAWWWILGMLALAGEFALRRLAGDP